MTVRIAALTVSVLLALGWPLFLLFWWKKRTGAKIRCALVGAAIFVVFALLLEQICHKLCLFSDNGVSAFFNNTTWAYVLYGGFAAGIFEETGRWVGFKFLLRKQDQRPAAIMYGVGHGGVEAVYIGFILLVQLLIVLGVPFAGGEAARASLQATPPLQLVVGGVERIIAVCLHIALSVLVFQAVKRPGCFWLYPLAILLHAGVDILAMLYQTGLLTMNIWLLEVLVALATAAIAVFAARRYRLDPALAPASLPTAPAEPETQPQSEPPAAADHSGDVQ